MSTEREAALDPLTPEERLVLRTMCAESERYSANHLAKHLVKHVPRLLQQLEEMERQVEGLRNGQHHTDTFVSDLLGKALGVDPLGHCAESLSTLAAEQLETLKHELKTAHQTRDAAQAESSRLALEKQALQAINVQLKDRVEMFEEAWWKNRPNLSIGPSIGDDEP